MPLIIIPLIGLLGVGAWFVWRGRSPHPAESADASAPASNIQPDALNLEQTFDYSNLTRPSLPQVATVNDATLPKGIRNNNPGNLRYYPSIPWVGQLRDDGSGYAVFDTPVRGLRAAMIDVRTGFTRDGEDTVRKIITEWAPHQENPTADYINYVASALGVGADTRLDYAAIIKPLMRAIVQFENGRQKEWYSASVYNQAYEATLS